MSRPAFLAPARSHRVPAHARVGGCTAMAHCGTVAPARRPRRRRVLAGRRPASAARRKRHVGPGIAPRHRPRRHQDRDRRARRGTDASVLRRRIADAAGRLRRDARGGRRRWSRDVERELGATRHASASARRARSRARPASCAARTRSASTASRSGATSSARSGARCASPTTPTASRCPRRPTARRRGAAVVFGVILGTGVGARHRRARPGARRAQRDRRRMGPQPAAVAARRRAAGPGLLLRPRRLHRDLAVRSRHRARPPARRPASALDAHDIVGARRRAATPRASATLARYEDRLARALAHVINLLDPDVIVLGGGMSNIDRLYANVPRAVGPRGCSPTASTRGSCATGTATPAACAAPRGCGGAAADRIARAARGPQSVSCIAAAQAM